MAEGGVSSIRDEWRCLFLSVQTTVAELLCPPPAAASVWSRYGGLQRMTDALESILNHGLKVVMSSSGSSLDYWNFVLGLRVLCPTTAPSIDAIAKQPESGRRWLQTCLLEHTTSRLLVILLGNKHHTVEHYEDHAFLLQPPYVSALLTCLRAVEENRAELLAHIDPQLCVPRPPPAAAPVPPRHVRSASLPVTGDMIRRSDYADPLAPPRASPKTESVLTLSGETARAASPGSSPDAAKNALLQVLNKNGEIYEDGDYDFYSTHNDPLLKHNDPLLPPYKHNDPLMASAVASSYRAPKRSTSNGNLHQVVATSNQHNVQINNQDNRNTIAERDVMSKSKSAQLLDTILSGDNNVDNNTTITSNKQFSSETTTSTSTNNKLLQTPDSGYSGSGVDIRGHHGNHHGNHNNGNRGNGSVHQSAGSRKQQHVRSMSDFGGNTPVPSSSRQPVDNESGGQLLSTSQPSQAAGSKLVVTVPGYFKQPRSGQSLVSFLSQQDFGTCAELERENAHFSICEALIAAIETIKWNQRLRPVEVDDHEPGDSDDEIQQLKQRIRIRRRERIREAARGFPGVVGSDTTSTTSTQYSSDTDDAVSLGEGSPTSSQEDFHDTDISDATAGRSNLTSLRDAGLSLSLASMYSDADLQRPPPAASPAPAAPPPSSAEAIALALLARFHQRHLPRAADLEWLVSEADAPQSLLPLPDSVPVSPDDLGEHSDLRPPQRAPTRLRGDLEWAPPRAQIVFNVHPTEKRKVVLSKQNFRCAGCGAKVENSTMKRYRFCEYLGKYFCPCCHTNKQYYIPARILHRWDFRLHPVSNFAFELLHRIQTDPLYSVDAINPGLYKKQKSLDSVRVLRLQLQHLSVFLATCRLARSLHDKLARLPTHAATDVHLYSLNELLQIHAGSLVPRLRTMVNDAVTHVTQCQLCRARGFICELCHSDDVLFPFELWRVTQCARCHGCCHARCVSAAAACPKCARIDARRRRRDQETPSPEPPDQ